MSRARILADYVAGGTTAAEFDYMDGVTSNVQTQLTALDTAKAPKASPAFTGTPTGITAAHLEAGVLPSDVTGGSGLTALGTVASGNLSNTAITYPAGHVVNTTFKGCSTSLTLNNQTHVFSTAAQGIENLAVTAGNKLAIWFMGGTIYTSTNTPTYYAILIKVNDNSSDTIYASSVFSGQGSDARFDSPSAFVFHTCVGTSIDLMYGIEGYFASSSYHFWLSPLHGSSGGQHAGDSDGLRFCVQEIQA